MKTLREPTGPAVQVQADFALCQSAGESSAGSAPIQAHSIAHLGRLMSKSRRPSNAHIRSMTKAFLGVEISRIRQKLKQLSAGTKESDKRRAADKSSADLSSESTKTIARSAIRRSNSGGFNTGSPGGPWQHLRLRQMLRRPSRLAESENNTTLLIRLVSKSS